MSSRASSSKIAGARSSPNEWLRTDYGESEYKLNFDADDDDSKRSTRTKPSGKDTLIRPSGAKGMLGKILDRMYRGEVMSQHEVSSAIQDYNRLQTRILQLEQKATTAELHVPDEVSAGIGAPGQKLTRDEKESLTEQIKRKDKLITDYQKRLKDLQHNTKTNPVKNVRTCDVAPPEKLVDKFCDTYENEWLNAYTALKASYKGDDEKAVFALFRIIRHAYVFCFDIAETQRTSVDDYSARLQEVMLQPSFTHPISKLKYRAGGEVTSENQRHLDVASQLIHDYRGIMVTQTIPAMQELFRKVKVPELFDNGVVPKAVRDYVKKIVEIIWLMVVQDPPMMVYWLEPQQTIVKEYFKYFRQKGSVAQQTVWPAVFSEDGGTLLSKGVVMACEKDDFNSMRSA